MANVRVRWIDSISAAATGNKILREDVEIADIANGVQEYIDTAAPDGATGLKYEVQTHDGAGDETTQEVEGENMDYIDTAAPPIGDLFPQDNAASHNEVDAVGSFVSERSGVITTDDDAYAGAKSILVTAGAETYSGAIINISGLEIGETYEITIWYNAEKDDNTQTLTTDDTTWSTPQQTHYIANLGWAAKTFTLVAALESGNAFYVQASRNPLVVGQWLMVDYISIIKQ